MKQLLTFSFLLLGVAAHAQDLKRLSFGVSMGVAAQRLNLKTYDNKPNLTVPTIQKHGTGFDLLVMARYKFNNNLSLRVMPGFLFQDMALLYKSPDEVHVEKRDFVEATVPIHIVYNWQMNTRFVPSFIAGANVGYNINAGNTMNKMAINRTNFGVDVGLGSEFKFQKFNCRPELIYTFGNSNLSVPSNIPYNAIIRSLTRDRVTFRLIFFG
jgi:Outer membrane protein beta-barrel domain